MRNGAAVAQGGPASAVGHPGASGPAVRLGVGSSSSCRRRIHLDHSPDADRSSLAPPDPAAALIRGEIGLHRVATLAQVDIPGVRLGENLRAGGRQAIVDILVPSRDGGFIPVLVRGHRTLDAGAGAIVSSLVDPLRWERSSGLRVRPHHEDALALAHCHRLLTDLGLAGPRAVGGVIGRGNPDDTTICWYDLSAPGVGSGGAAVSFGAVSFGLGGPVPVDAPDADTGPVPSVLDDYDARFADRVAVAEAALRRELPLALPSRVSECRRCPWNPLCTTELTQARDVSLIAPGTDAAGLRAVGVLSIDDLAAADDDQLATVAPSRNTGALRGPELRLRARAWLADAVLIRRRDQVAVPRADLELDVDMECFIDDGAYLWGTYLTGSAAGMEAATGAGFESGYQPFVTWHPLPDRAEGVMFAEFWAYLRELQLVATAAGLTFAAYCYSRQAEERWLFSTPARYPDVPGMPTAQEVRSFTSSGSWVDMYEMLGREFLAAGSKRLKTVAPLAGFRWRDAEPDGANSMVWYRAAVGGDGVEPSESQKQRLLEYNEDDVLATLALRRWMSAGAGEMPTVEQLSGA